MLNIYLFQASDVVEPTPKNLYLTAAILIREGFITLEDLYPHVKLRPFASIMVLKVVCQLSPSDSDMDQFHKDYLAEVQTRIGGAKISVLALAAPLSQDGAPAP